MREYLSLYKKTWDQTGRNSSARIGKDDGSYENKGNWDERAKRDQMSKEELRNSSARIGKGEIQARKRSRETSMSKAEIKIVSGKTAVVKKQKQRNKKTQQPAENCPCGVLQTRSSPRVLCNGMLQLKPNQKACLEEIGFGSMVEFNASCLLRTSSYISFMC
ncbi:hypothetical protein Tco_1435250 [Tanacetum coccineum]